VVVVVVVVRIIIASLPAAIITSENDILHT
jgi:hypothetical protein